MIDQQEIAFTDKRLAKIVDKLNAQEHHEAVYVAKDYTRADLIEDLEIVQNQLFRIWANG